MDKEILNFLFSGVLSSILISIITLVYQSYSLKRKRNKKLEELKIKRRKEISNLRLSQIENEATNIFYWAKKIYLQFQHFPKKNINRKKLEELTVFFTNSTNIYPIGKLLNDEELVKSVRKFDLTCMDLYSWVEKAAVIGDSRNIQELNDLFEKLQLDYSYVLKCLDEFRVKRAVKL